MLAVGVTGAPTLADPQPIKAHLDLVLLALEAIAELNSEAMLHTAARLHLTDTIGDRLTLWRLRQSSPLRKGKGGRKRLDVDEARALTLIASELASQHHSKIRQTVAHLEAYSQKGRAPHQAPMVGDYLDRFFQLYEERMEERPPEALALKLLVDLLFYSAPTGDRRLWLNLLERSSPSS
ncbi:MAG: DUF3038 domain-containing protein [Oscillatoriales cyanobacterium SM2_2_1]|nr:DUF3038 domain-containing protein [Oscillatoriales cyanobacterium SM2_2_1]